MLRLVANLNLSLLVSAALVSPAALAAEQQADALRVLFLGDNGHHRPAERARQLIPAMAHRGIKVTYTDDLDVLDLDTLQQFDGLLIYANITEISPRQEKALLAYVEQGGGFIPVHCASYCFLNSEPYIKLVGAQFQRHGAGVFRTTIAQPEHPLMRGFAGFESWDETYVHHRHWDRDRLVLAYREEGGRREPWTWIRTHGKGRVFYTAWGHDHRTWGHSGFQNLLERGIRWACKADPGTVAAYHDPNVFPVPSMTAKRTDVEPFQYVDVGPKIPNYTPDASWGTQGPPNQQMQQPLPPEESLKHFVTPLGFSVRLFASEPQLGGKPIAMNWDDRGRLWVCETVDYPNELRPPGQGRDRIRICEDTDGDGKADKFVLFAEGLSIPTAITCYRGGVIVQDGKQTLYLKDTDGDGRADLRNVLISNWALGDTHGGVSNFQYGIDNWIWAMQGYNASQPVVEDQQQQGFRMGFFRFRLSNTDPPHVTDLEFLRSTNNNTWGLGLSETGLVFGSTANRNPSVYMPIPNRFYEQVRGWSAAQLGTIADTHRFQPITSKVRQVDHHGGYTAGAGHALYTARVYPQEYWNRTAFVCGPTGHLVGTFVLRGEGSDFRSTSPFNLVASDDEWSAPIMAEVGPDGNVWVLDWYNFIVQHNPTPRGFKTGRGNAYESDLRDKRHGRIYRVVYNQSTPSQQLSLEGATPRQLVQTLRHPTMLWRKTAQRLLVERGQPDVVPQLLELARDESVDEIGINAGVIHALWTLHGLSAFDGAPAQTLPTAIGCLRHPSAGVRRNAVQVLPRTQAVLSAILQTGLLHDGDAQVRLAALLALAEMPANASAANALASAVQDAENLSDRWIPDAATSAAAAHAEEFLLAAAARREQTHTRVRQLCQVVAEHYARGDETPALAQLLAALGQADPQLAGAIVAGLSAGWPDGRKVDTSTTTAALLPLFKRLAPEGRGELLKLAAKWGSRALDKHLDEVLQPLLDTLADDEASPSARRDAAQQLVRFRSEDDRVVEHLLAAITPRTSPDTATEIIGALAQSRAPRLGPLVLQQLDALLPVAKQEAVRVLLARPESTQLLLDAVEQGQFGAGDLSLRHRQRLLMHPDGQLRDRARALLSQAGGLPNPDRQKVLEELLSVATQTGDVVRGKAVYTKHCAICHKHGTEGKQIGPDLTGMAVHPKSELMVHILDPNRSVEGNYRQYTAVTLGGKILDGMLAAETKTTIELFDDKGERHVVLRDDIDELLASKKSLMPEGFEKQINRQELTDLLEFLTAKGRFLPLPIAQAATAISTKGLFHPGDNGPDRMIFADWGPKHFAGVPFQLVDPADGRTANIILLNGPQGTLPPTMPKAVRVTCNTAARSIHLLSGVGGWSYPAHSDQTVSLIVRLHYADGRQEDHPLQNGIHFADYIRRVDVPESKFAFALRGRQIRYLAVTPRQAETIQEIEFLKGNDPTAPIIMAVTIETNAESTAASHEPGRSPQTPE